MSGLAPSLRSPWFGETRTSATTQESGRNADTSATIRQTIDDERGRNTAAKPRPEAPQTTAASCHYVARAAWECKDMNLQMLWMESTDAVDCRRLSPLGHRPGDGSGV